MAADGRHFEEWFVVYIWGPHWQEKHSEKSSLTTNECVICFRKVGLKLTHEVNLEYVTGLLPDQKLANK